MSAKELILKIEEGGGDLIISFKNDILRFQHKNDCIEFDRNEAHLLMLYLQEHLGNPVPTIEKKLWYCPRCDKYHAENYVCEKIDGNKMDRGYKK